MSYQKPDAKMVQALKDIANKMRIHSVNMTSAANSG
jgi:transketolase